MNRSALRIAFLSLAFTSITVVLAFAQSATFARTDHPSLGNDHIAADLNGDGRMDLAGLAARSVVVMLGNGDASFAARAEYPVADSTQALAAGDFNGDGSLDLVVTINNPDIGLALLTGRGDGTFNAAVSLPNAARLDGPAVAAADLNNDGNLDVVVGHQVACFTAPCVVATTITVLQGNGNGTFQPARHIEVGSGTSAIAAGDLDHDGFKDLVLASDRSRVNVLINDGDGTFTRQTVTLIPENNIGMDNTDVDVADVNGDSIEDAVVALSLNGSRTVVLLGVGDGTFRAPIFMTEPALRVPQYQAIADYNGDGRLDLAISLANGNEGLMEIRTGNGDGTFGAPVLYLAPPAQSSIGGLKIVSADFNGDRKADLALGWGGASSGVALLRNTTGTSAPPRPPAPSLVSPGDGASVSQPVTLDWTDVANAAKYEVQIDDSSTLAAPFVSTASVSSSQVTLSGLPARRLWWRVRAVNTAGVAGSFSSARRFTPLSSGPAPAPAPVSLASLALSPATVTGGASTSGSVTLSAAAPAGGVIVALSSSNTTVATVPATVAVAAGATKATFAAGTNAVSASAAVTISGSFSGVTRSAVLTVNPPGVSATLTVTATGRSGERVLSSPAGISVQVGSTGSGSFTTGTSITLSVSNGRDAIWSGACSSGGDKRRTCTFTLNGNATVSANVQ